MFSLKDKVAIVTGASRGIGKAIAIQLSNSGAKVVVSSRKLEECEKVADEIKNMGGKAVVIPCHVGKKDEICNLVKETINKYNSIDILVSNAGTNPAFGPLEKLNDDAFDKVLDVNLKSSIWLVNEASPHLKKNKTSSIIIMSSISALIGTKDIGAYGISKAAEVSLVKNLAVELGPYGIRVNAIAPGEIETSMITKNSQHLIKQIPMGRFGKPEEVASVIFSMCSESFSYVNGTEIQINGGQTV